MYRLKNVFSQILFPCLKVTDHLNQSWQKLWSFAWLNACLKNIDESVVILGKPDLHGTRNIRLGRNLYLYRDLHLETQNDGFIDISDDVVLSRGVHIVAFENIIIGEGSMIGEYTSIRDANHTFGQDIKLREAGHQAKSIHIGKHVWIGRGVSILAGVAIGDGAVIGANSVVTHDVPPYTVVAGAPARPLHNQTRGAA